MRPAQAPYSRLKEQFEELALRHTAKHGFRTYDLLHVASALLLGCDTFWSFDAKAKKLAKLAGGGGGGDGGEKDDGSFFRVSLEHQFDGVERHCMEEGH